MNKLALKLAHKIRKEFNTWSEALKMAWAKIKLQNKLRKGIAHFFFTKKNGETREAFGTVESYTAKKESTRKMPWYIVFFIDTKIDPSKHNARSCDIRRLLKIN